MFAPGFDCANQPAISAYPHQIIGASAGFILGQNIVCGGAIFDYKSCHKHSEGSKFCNRNTDCVTTLGGSQWCTGPKTKECFSYDLVDKTWSKTLDLKTARAYAGKNLDYSARNLHQPELENSPKNDLKTM